MKQLKMYMLFFLTSALIAQIKYVPTDYSIIQHAINDAEDGDTIIVEEGIYCQQFNFKGKAITVASEFFLDGDTSHISKTIIDGICLPERDSSSLVYFISGEDTNSVLTGFTLQNGKGTYRYFSRDDWACKDGGAVYISESGAKITNNIFRNNNLIMVDDSFDYTWAGGAGISCSWVSQGTAVIVDNNSFLNNSIESGNYNAFGGALDFGYISGSVVISKNKIIGNKVKSRDSGYGGGISICDASLDSDILIDNNYIANNKAYSKSGASKGAGIACYFAAPTIRNNVIVYNETKYPQYKSHNAFGGGIAVFWYKNLEYYFNTCEDPLKLHVNIENNTIAFNNDKLAGGGVALRSVAATLKNNIIGCNFSENDAQIKIEYPDAPKTDTRTVKVEYCNIEGWYGGEGNINEIPNFIDNENWYLKRDLSPCIDTGDPSQEYEDIEDPAHSGKACFPALGTKRNDMGAFGGPHSKWQEMSALTTVEEIAPILIERLYLSQNYPNPFNPRTTIKYKIPAEGKIKNSKLKNVILRIYDILGREVSVLVYEKQKPGNYEVIWNPSAEGIKLPSGVYFYKLNYGDYTITKRLILLK